MSRMLPCKTWARCRRRPTEFGLAQANGGLHRPRRPVPRRSTHRRTVAGADWRRAHPPAVAPSRSGRRARRRAESGRYRWAHRVTVADPSDAPAPSAPSGTAIPPVLCAAWRLARRGWDAARGMPAGRGGVGGGSPQDGVWRRGGRRAAAHHMCSRRPPFTRDRDPGPLQRHGGYAGPGPACPAHRQHGGGQGECPAGQPAHQRPVRTRAAGGPGSEPARPRGFRQVVLPGPRRTRAARHNRTAGVRACERPGWPSRREWQLAVHLGLGHALRQVAHTGQAGPGMAEQALGQRGRHPALPATHDGRPARAVAAVLAGNDLRGHRLPEMDPGSAEQFGHGAGWHSGDLRHPRGAQAVPGRQRQRLPFRRRQAHHRAQGHSRRAVRVYPPVAGACQGPMAQAPAPRPQEEPGPQRS